MLCNVSSTVLKLPLSLSWEEICRKRGVDGGAVPIVQDFSCLNQKYLQPIVILALDIVFCEQSVQIRTI